MLLAAPLLITAQTPAPAGPGVLTLRITTPDGDPIGAVEIADTAAHIVGATNTAGFARLVVPTGKRIVRLRRIGFEPRIDTVDVRATGISNYTFELTARPQQLEPQVVATERRRRGLYGTVVGLDLDGIPGAEVTVLGSGSPARTDSLGHFDLPVARNGNQLVTVRRLGYRPRTVSLDITGGSEIIIPMIRLPDDHPDMRAGSGFGESGPLVDFATRRAGAGPNQNIALVSHAELAATRTPFLHDAMMRSPELTRRGLRTAFDRSVNLFICLRNGVYDPSETTRQIRVEDVEAVEVIENPLLALDVQSRRRRPVGQRGPAGIRSSSASADAAYSGLPAQCFEQQALIVNLWLKDRP